jgi:hypothetical protein
MTTKMIREVQTPKTQNQSNSLIFRFETRPTQIIGYPLKTK